MSDKYVLATDDNGNLAVRTVTAEESPTANSTDVITATTDGKLAVRVVGAGGGGGGDQHNLGWYATESALTTAHPTASDGDYAIVGETDTVWVWDSDTTAWKDTDTKGQVTSVNGQTGAVTVDTLPDQTGQSGKFLTTDGTDASWANAAANWAKGTESFVVGYSSSYCYDRAGTLRNTVVNGYSNYSRDSVAVGYGAGASSTGSTCVGRSAQSAANYSISIGFQARTNAQYAIQLGYDSANNDANTFKVANGNGNYEMMSADGTIPSDRLVHAINKYSTMPTAASTNEGWIVQFTGTTDSTYTHGHLYECVSDGQDPATYSWTEVQLGGGGLQNTATGTNALAILGSTTAGWSVVLGASASSTGETSVVIGYNAKITGNYSYKSVCIGNGATVTSDSCVCIGRSASASYSGDVVIGEQAKVTGTSNSAISIGKEATASAQEAYAIGAGATATATGAIQIGRGTNNVPYTMRVNTHLYDLSKNVELLSADGTIPAARHASLPAADGTYTLQLVIADGVPTLSWVAV